MNVLVLISSGGERTSEPQYTSKVWSDLTDRERNDALIDLKRYDSGLCLEFNRNEALALQRAGLFNGPAVGGFVADLLSVKTQTVVDKDGDIMVKLLARFRHDTSPTPPDNTLVGTVLPNQLTRNLDKAILTGPGPVSR